LKSYFEVIKKLASVVPPAGTSNVSEPSRHLAGTRSGGSFVSSFITAGGFTERMNT
jgi:hypothetical protein